MEVLVGSKGDDTNLRDFLATCFDVLPLDIPVAETAVVLRRTHRMRLPDAIIWATAQVYSAILVTRNTKNFDPDWGGIRVPYTI
jgi:predicted nucleic acid-binding protein